MAADYIVVNKTKTPGASTVALANAIRSVRENVAALVAIGNHMWDGSDYTVLEAQFGLAAGTGANFLTLLGLMNGVFNTEDTISGAQRKAWLDEFVARLSGQ